MSKYYVRLRGRVQGPYSVRRLGEKLTEGSFSRIHEVSEDKRHWRGARTLTELFGESEPDVREPKLVETPIVDLESAEAQPATTKQTEGRDRGDEAGLVTTGEDAEPLSLTEWIARAVRASCICAAVVLVVCGFFPHMRDVGGLMYWWNAGNQSNRAALVMFGLYAPVAAGVLALSTWWLTGIVRGWTLIVTGAVGLLLVWLAVVSAPCRSFLFCMSVPGAALVGALTAALIGNRLAPGGADGGLAKHLATGGAGLSFLAAAGAMVSLVSYAMDDTMGFWAVAAAGMGLVVWAVMMVMCAAVVMYEDSVREGYWLGFIVKGLLGCLALGAAAALVGALAVIGARGDQWPLERFFFVQMMRVLVSVVCLSGLVGLGIVEVRCSAGAGDETKVNG